MRIYHFSFFTLFLLGLGGCTVVLPTPSTDKIAQVETMLYRLHPTQGHQESKRLSKEIFTQTAHLTQAFNLTSPPWFHNILVNTGIRKRGLCYHWSDSLYIHLTKQYYHGFSFHLAGANIGSCLREHNALVVTSSVGSFNEGIVIDPWRDSGTLFVSPVENDPDYQWEHRPDRELKR